MKLWSLYDTPVGPQPLHKFRVTGAQMHSVTLSHITAFCEAAVLSVSLPLRDEMIRQFTDNDSTTKKDHECLNNLLFILRWKCQILTGCMLLFNLTGPLLYLLYLFHMSIW